MVDEVSAFGLVVFPSRHINHYYSYDCGLVRLSLLLLALIPVPSLILSLR